MRALGRIVRLHVQRDSLKSGTKPQERYTPLPNLISVKALGLDDNGVSGMLTDGEIVLDVHNRTHRHSKFRGDNGISAGFTSHYDAMRTRFGDHLTDGIAGENMLVSCGEMVALDDIANGIVIVGEKGEIHIGPWVIAHPCTPFSKFCLQFPEHAKPDKRITETLQFLENGMRGFTAVYGSDISPTEIHLGDMVYAVD